MGIVFDILAAQAALAGCARAIYLKTKTQSVEKTARPERFELPTLRFEA